MTRPPVAGVRHFLALAIRFYTKLVAPTLPWHLSRLPTTGTEFGTWLAALACNAPEQARLLFQQTQSQLINTRGEQGPKAWLVEIDNTERLGQSGAPEPAHAPAVEIANKVEPSIDPTSLWADRLRRQSALI